MFEAFVISVSLKLNNLVSPQLVLLAKEFEKLDLLTVSLNKSLSKLSVDATGLRALATATNATNRAFERAAVSAEAYERRLGALNRLGAGSRGFTPQLPGSSGRGSGGGFHGGNIHFGAGGIGLGTAGLAAGDAFVPLAVAGAAIYAGKSLFEAAKDLDTERQRFKLFGLNQQQNADAFGFVGGMHVYGQTQAENMRVFREAQGVFRESGMSGDDALRGAKLAAPILAKLDFLGSTLDEESAARMRTANLAMLRYVESSGGLKSAEAFNRIAEFGFKLNTSSGGTVNWEQLRQFKARAGAAGFNLTDDAMARLEPIIAEMKGGAVGFGLSTAFNRLTGSIRIPNQVAHQLIEQGVWDKAKVIFNSQGGIKTFTGNPLGQKNSDLLMTNPEMFYETVIRPIYDKMKLSTTDIARENVMLFGTTGGRNMTLVENQMAAIHRSVDAMAKVQGIDAAVKTGKESLTGEEREFGAAWTDFKTQFGTTILPFFTGILKGGADLFRSINAVPAETKSQVMGTGFDFLRAIAFGDPSGLVGSATNFIASTTAEKALNIHTSVNIDGKKVAESVNKVNSRSLGAPQTGLSGFDSTMTPWPAGGASGSF